MKTLLKNLFLVPALFLLGVSTAAAQAVTTTRSFATPTPVSRSTGAARSAEIKADFLRQRQAIIQRELRQAIRCIENAQINLRDTEGMVNRVKSTDLLNCTRRLSQLRAELAKLGQQSTALQEEAAQAEIIARALEQQIPGQ